MDFVYYINLAGIFVFSISGALTARTKKLDIFGASVIAFVTALGGGTIRDVLLGNTPVGWMLDLNNLLMVMLGLIGTFLVKKSARKFRRAFFWADAIGIGMFAIAGLEKSLQFGVSPVIALLLGVISAVFGGVLRDILCNEIPLIFRPGGLYATACAIGGVFFLLLKHFNVNANLNMVLTVLLVIAIRVISLKKRFVLPTL